MACTCRPLSSCILNRSSFTSSSRYSKASFIPPSRRKPRPIDTLRSTASDGPPDVFSEEGPTAPDPVKLTFAKSQQYREDQVSKLEIEQKMLAESPNSSNSGEGYVASPPQVPGAVKLAMEKAKEYKKNKRLGGPSGNIAEQPGPKVMPVSSGINPGEQSVDKFEKKGLTVSSIDFVGLNFSDKKKGRGLPAGLAPVVDSFPEGDFPEVEMIIGDLSKFDKTQSIQSPSVVYDESSKLYKPKVSTWGVFPRPENISKTFGGGRNIRPGDSLETAEVRAANEARSRQLIATYKSQIGLNIDPKTKAECEKDLKDGNYLMDLGKLREALPYYEKVMKAVVFQSELHGLAALQWSICQDSLSRPDEARLTYEKLQSHPNAQVSKKARHLVFSFKAMEMMKMSRFSSSERTGYENYFEAFLDEKTSYSQDNQGNDEDVLKQLIPYALFLLSPILLVFLIASSRA